MIDRLLSFVAPHHCCSCGKSGSLLCDDCKYNIDFETKSLCLECLRPCGATGLCNTCRVPYSRAWHVGERKDVLQRLIGLYKFERAKAAYVDLGDLLLAALPDLPPDIIVVPIPTLASHIRQRGYDHTLLIARHVAKTKHLKLEQALVRRSATTQRYSSASVREIQAKDAFGANQKLDQQKTYLLIDDVATTRSTIKYAAKTLRDAGAGDVWVAVIARQVLD